VGEICSLCDSSLLDAISQTMQRHLSRFHRTIFVCPDGTTGTSAVCHVVSTSSPRPTTRGRDGVCTLPSGKAGPDLKETEPLHFLLAFLLLSASFKQPHLLAPGFFVTAIYPLDLIDSVFVYVEPSVLNIGHAWICSYFQPRLDLLVTVTGKEFLSHRLAWSAFGNA